MNITPRSRGAVMILMDADEVHELARLLDVAVGDLAANKVSFPDYWDEDDEQLMNTGKSWLSTLADTGVTP